MALTHSLKTVSKPQSGEEEVRQNTQCSVFLLAELWRETAECVQRTTGIEEPAQRERARARELGQADICGRTPSSVGTCEWELPKGRKSSARKLQAEHISDLT